jgi:hypothetical protein
LFFEHIFLIYHGKNNFSINRKQTSVAESFFQNEEITQIKITNFMSFNDITIIPSSGLTLINGSNDSEKLSIVYAVGLGL